MDLITIATTIGSAAKAAKSAWDAGEALYTFIKDTRMVNKTLQNLVSSVKAFGDTCNLVRSSLETLQTVYKSNKGSLQAIQTSKDQLLWRGIRERLDECQDVIGELRESISEATKERSSFLGQAWRQYKFNWKQDDRIAIQNRLQSHSTALSLSLQAIKIRVDHLIPRQADNDLLRELREVRTLIKQNNDATDHANHNDELVKYARDMFDDGATLYKASVANGSVVGDEDTATIVGGFRESDSDWIHRWSAEIPLTLREHSALFRRPRRSPPCLAVRLC